MEIALDNLQVNDEIWLYGKEGILKGFYLKNAEGYIYVMIFEYGVIEKVKTEDIFTVDLIYRSSYKILI